MIFRVEFEVDLSEFLPEDFSLLCDKHRDIACNAIENSILRSARAHTQIQKRNLISGHESAYDSSKDDIIKCDNRIKIIDQALDTYSLYPE
jgi:hypothetical protein